MEKDYKSLSEEEKLEIKKKVDHYNSEKRHPWKFFFKVAKGLIPFLIVAYIISLFHSMLETELVHYYYFAAVVAIGAISYKNFWDDKPSSSEFGIVKKYEEEKREKEIRGLRRNEINLEKARSSIEKDIKLIQSFKSELKKIVDEKSDLITRRKKTVNYRVDKIKEIDPFEFEEYVAELYKCMNYEVQVTSKSGDKGVDIFVKRDNEKSVVQCKRYQEIVHAKELRDFLGVIRYHNADKGYFVTTGVFSESCLEFESHGIELIDNIKLVELSERLINNKNRLVEIDKKIDVINDIILNKIDSFFRMYTYKITDSNGDINNTNVNLYNIPENDLFYFDVSKLHGYLSEIRYIYEEINKYKRYKT